MGLFDWLFRRKKQPALPSAPHPRPTPIVSTSPARVAQPFQTVAAMEWVPPGSTINAGGRTIPGGMIYVGGAIPGDREPSLIDPRLPVSAHATPYADLSLPYWPSYDRLSPENRATYLQWLARNRRDPEAPVGLIFIFMYGLERRVLVDLPRRGFDRGELLAIRQEMVELLVRYGAANNSFRGYARRFIDLVDAIQLLQAPSMPAPSELIIEPGFVPTPLRYALGKLSADGIAIRGELAAQWAWYHPENQLRAPAYRCRDDLLKLFKLRFDERFPGGLQVKSGKSIVKLHYRPASAGIEPREFRFSGVPDTFSFAVPGGKLVELFQQVTDELMGYSRILGRDPSNAGSLAAIATLPKELIPNSSQSVVQLQDWLARSLADESSTVVSGRDLIAHWPSVSPGKLTKTESVAFAQLLQALGYGLEPDVRFGGPVLTDQMHVGLFRLVGGAPQSPTASYAAAALLTHLAVAVGSADGALSEDEAEALRHHLEQSLGLAPGERDRLAAHAARLGAGEVKLTGLKKRLDTLDDATRTHIGKIMISVAAADGVISPGEVSTLIKIYTVLGLNPDAVTSELHAAMTDSAPPARGPVTVRPAGVPESGQPVPARPTPADDDGAARGIALDPATITEKLQQSAEISSLLTAIFSEEETAELAPAPPPAAPDASQPDTVPAGDDPAIAGLDATHSRLFLALVERENWDRPEFDDLCATFALMPGGAIDVLNEAAFERTEEPLIEGDDPLSINPYAREGMRS